LKTFLNAVITVIISLYLNLIAGESHGCVRFVQTMQQNSFWQGDDLICWDSDQVGFQYFPTLIISLAASANETMRLVVSPRQYLRLVSDSEWYSAQMGFDYNCYRVSISPSVTGSYFVYVSLVSSALGWFAWLMWKFCLMLYRWCL